MGSRAGTRRRAALVASIIAVSWLVVGGGTAGAQASTTCQAQFLHVVDAVDSSKLTSLPAFVAFQQELADRCLVKPVPCNATVVGNYRMLGE